MTNNMTPAKIVSMVTGALVLAGLVLWGVPYYIGSKVRAQVTTELAALPADPHPVTAANFATNTTKIANIEATVLRMEQRMIERDEIILQYFQDKAGEDD